jgi:predicted TPR repeat methyltransferase
MNDRTTELQEDIRLLLKYLESGKTDQVENLFGRILEAPPDSADDLHALAGVAYRMGRPEKAVELITDALQRDSTRDYFHLNLGNLLMSQGRLPEAILSFRRALSISPDFAEAHNNLGVTLRALGKTHEAIASYRRALAVNPNYAEAHNNLGIVLDGDGKREEAIASFRQALAVNPDFAEARLNLASALETWGEGDGDIEIMQRKLTLNPNLAEAHNNLGIALKKGGRVDEATISFRRAIEINPNFAEAHYNLGNTLSAEGRQDEAIASYRSAVAVNPDYAEAYNNLGIVLKARDKMDDAVACYRRAIEINSRYIEAHYNLGLALKELGKAEEASALLGRVLDLDPAHRRAAHMMAALTGKTTEGAPGEYVKDLFDRYSPEYDRHLTETLAYNAPRLLRRALDSMFDKIPYFRNALDLGCGTGLAGTEFRAITHRLSGIDISPGMIEVARKKGVYDFLAVGDILEYLRGTEERYDLFAAADVFTYMGNLKPVFSAVSRCSLSRACFVFSTEKTDREDYVLRPTGRYAHSRRYIQDLARDHGFSLETCRTGALRKEKERWIMGESFVLRRTDSP